jgi:MerR family transcriptional regulator, light-induced transcriptional regulator
MAQRSDDTVFHTRAGSGLADSGWSGTNWTRPHPSPSRIAPPPHLAPDLPEPDLPEVMTQTALPPVLYKTIEGEVIPRLLMALKTPGGPSPIALLRPSADQIDELADLAVGPDEAKCGAYVDHLRLMGMSLEAIYLDLLAPAARRLNTMWVEDICDFNDVTIGLGRLHMMVRKLSPTFRASVDQLERGSLNGRCDQRRALIAPMPGDTHSFGCVMIEDFFTRAGWDVCGWPVSLDADLAELVACDHYDLVGLSVSCDLDLKRLSRLIRQLRRASRNKALVVAVGGRAFVDDPAQSIAVGADFTATNGREAVTRANAHLDRLFERA